MVTENPAKSYLAEIASHTNEGAHNTTMKQILSWDDRLRWVGYVISSGIDHLINNVFWIGPDGTRSVRCPRKRWKDPVKGDLQKMGVRQWEIVTQN